MPCRGICIKYKAAREERGGHYGNGHKRCNECELFLAWPGAKCPCCRQVLRTKPHNTRLKARMRKS